MSSSIMRRALDLSRDVAIRWRHFKKGHAELLARGGITAVLADGAPAAFLDACGSHGIAVYPASDVSCLALDELLAAKGPGPFALTNGNWPGIAHGANSNDDAVASASQQPWLDADGFWAVYLKALFPSRPAVLGYEPDEKAGVKADRIVPYDSLELALVDAWAWGGNYILSMERDFEQALDAGDAKAVAAWEQLGRTTRWLREKIDLFRQPAIPILTTLVETGDDTAEIANLQCRNNASPALERVDNPPAPDPRRRLVVAAVNLKAGRPAKAAGILQHAVSGSILVVDDPAKDAWWRVSGLKLLGSQEDREFYSLGAGQVVAYKERISDPSEFALDMIDLVGQKRRAVRLWAAPTVIGRVVYQPGGFGRRVSLIAVNYGSPIDTDVQVRVQGNFGHARMIRPDSGPVDLQTAKRGTATEIMIPEIRKTVIVLFD